MSSLIRILSSLEGAKDLISDRFEWQLGITAKGTTRHFYASVRPSETHTYCIQYVIGFLYDAGNSIVKYGTVTPDMITDWEETGTHNLEQAILEPYTTVCAQKTGD